MHTGIWSVAQRSKSPERSFCGTFDRKFEIWSDFNRRFEANILWKNTKTCRLQKCRACTIVKYNIKYTTIDLHWGISRDFGSIEKLQKRWAAVSTVGNRCSGWRLIQNLEFDTETENVKNELCQPAKSFIRVKGWRSTVWHCCLKTRNLWNKNTHAIPRSL